MAQVLLGFLLYFLRVTVYLLGVFVCGGLLVNLIEKLVAKLMGKGSGALFDITSVIGTPVHELGHAAMCVVFRHKITSIRLWRFHPQDGVYGYVEHSYSRRNIWSRFGNLFVGMGPLFSGIGVTVLTLWLCFPALWTEYLHHSYALVSADGIPFRDLLAGILMLFRGIPDSFRADWLRSLLGLLIILPVSLHISMSPKDIKGSLNSLPFVLLLLALFSAVTYWTPARAPILSWLRLTDLRLLSLFALVISFALFWLAFALLLRMIRTFVSWF